MDHADIHVIRAEVGEHRFKRGADLIDPAGRAVLPVLPDGAQVRLEDERPPAVPDRPARPALDVGVGGVEVHAVDPVFKGQLEELFGKGVVPEDEALAAQSDLADPQAGFSKFTVVHRCSAFLLSFVSPL